MSKTLYLECYSGISGDMVVGALLDLGADQQVLQKALDSLPVSGFQTKISRVLKAGLDVCDFAVCLDALHENHDHDMEYLHGHSHNQEVSHHHHEHRGLPEILSIIDRCEVTPAAGATAKKILRILADAEAKAHGLPVEQVHFHEVGAVDSIVDIVAAAVCLDNLGITQVLIPELTEGCGTIRCQHGILPVPVPAVMNIAAAYGLKLHLTDSQGEFVTPTGAAIAAAIRTSDRLPKHFTIEKTGLGAGKRNYDRPGFLRAILIREEQAQADIIWKLETNIDDCSGEIMGLTMEFLLKAGAKDVHYTPVFMKKNRPAYQLNVICSAEDVEKMEQIIFENTTTIGIRRMEMSRTALKRELRTCMTSFGEVRYKICEAGASQKIYPEYESVAEVCRKYRLSYEEAYQRVLNEYH